MSQKVLYLNTRFYKNSLASLLLMAAMSVHAAPTAPNADAANPTVAPINQPAVGDASTSSALDINDTLAAQLQPSTKALSAANQELLSRNAQLQRQVNDLQTQANVLVYESKGQLFLYGAFTVLISLLVGIFISWLVFVRRDRW
ncbi:hypothetical protein ACTXGK_05900 [Psychrobacter sp. T6-5]